MLWQELNGKALGNKSLKVADVTPRTYEKRRQGVTPPPQSQTAEGVEDGDEVDDDTSNPGSSILKGRSARDAVTPLAHMSYADQLDHKKNSLAQTLKKLVRILFHCIPIFSVLVNFTIS